jgi:hypothetical protein
MGVRGRNCPCTRTCCLEVRYPLGVDITTQARSQNLRADQTVKLEPGRLRQMDCGLQSLEEVVNKLPACLKLLASKLDCTGPAVQIPPSGIAEFRSRYSMMMSSVDHLHFAQL